MSLRIRSLLGVVALCWGVCVAPAHAWQIPEGVKSTQKPEDKPLSPEESLARIKLPEGFKATLFAAEPHIAQPIAFTFDDRGRLWVAECYSYGQWDKDGKKGQDRIVILHDVDNDGQFDKRTVFAENLANLSGIEIGFGGVWICSAPNLSFIPDANRDDKPDGPPVAKIDGWVVGNVGHNIFSNLTWGPDGWLYGLHGIQDESKIGKPGTPDEERIKMRCGVWRYHPVKDRIEVVCHGTTNPWGLDFNEFGDGFMTNCVIGHLWQVIPGAHYKRMYGEDYNRYAYELLDQHADHLHWAGEKWQASRDGAEHDKLGGGHAHTGAMIYLADNWPAKYRSMIGMCNVHGQRLNFDKLERQGSGYVGRRGEDMFFADNPWFRGVTVKYGPDGGVYISDWCDLGECHDNDGVHRTSGRIYKVTYEKSIRDAIEELEYAYQQFNLRIDGQPTTSVELCAKPFDVAKCDNDLLVHFQVVRNAWWSRRAMLELAHRAAQGQDLKSVHAKLKRLNDGPGRCEIAIRAMAVLHVTGGADEGWLLTTTEDKDEFVRRRAIYLLVEADEISPKICKRLEEMADSDPSPLVRLALASSLQKLPLAQRWPIAANLVSHEEDNEDHNLPLMIWYGIEPAVAADKSQALKLATQSKLSKVRQFIAKRVAEASK